MWETFVRLIDAAQDGNHFAWVLLIILGAGALAGAWLVFWSILRSWTR